MYRYRNFLASAATNCWIFVRSVKISEPEKTADVQSGSALEENEVHSVLFTKHYYFLIKNATPTARILLLLFFILMKIDRCMCLNNVIRYRATPTMRDALACNKVFVHCIPIYSLSSSRESRERGPKLPS